MRLLLSYIGILLFFAHCQNERTVEAPLPALTASAMTDIPSQPKDTMLRSKPYSMIVYDKVEILRAAPGTKSVLFNSNGSKLYAMNLEGLSIYEFDQASRKVMRQFKFKPTKGMGWDYERDTIIPSLQEKPVEACLSHNDKILWVSLHNAGGIVPIWLDPLSANQPIGTSFGRSDSVAKEQSPIIDTTAKKITVVYPGTNNRDSFTVPLIKTGKTPKIISRTADSKYLLVSNWHSYTVSILEVDKDQYPFAKLVNTIPMPAIPRGIVVDDKNNKSYVAIMGGATLAVINNQTWKKDGYIPVATNPRHVVMDTSGHIFVSYNLLGKVACLDAATGNTLFTATTHGKPRTIILSKNQKFLFATCYSSDTVDVFKIHPDSFEKISSLPCKGHPVGVDLYENDDKLEAWVCSYVNGTISVFSFKKRYR